MIGRLKGINREMLRLAIPNILSNISVPLLSSVDTALMGRLSELHLGAIGLGAMIFNFIYWNFGFLRMGTTGMTAQAYGGQSGERIVHTLSRGLFMAMTLAVLILFFRYSLIDAGNSLLDVSGEMQPFVSEYFSVRVWAAPATLALYVMMGWYFGMQNAFIPLILTLVINVVNIVLSIYFVQGLGMEVRGVALGTVIAQYSGFLLAVAIFLGRYRSYLKHYTNEMMWRLGAFRDFLSVNGDIFLRTVMLTLAFGFFYRQSSGLGETVLAVNVILLQYLNWMSYGVDGFAYAAESLVGKYYGSANDRMLKLAISRSMLWGLGLGAGIAAVYGFFGSGIFTLFTDKSHLLAEAQKYLWWMIVLPLAGSPSYIWDGIYIGLTASRAMRNSMMVAFALFIASYYLSSPWLGNHGLWFALLFFLFFRGLAQWWLYARSGKYLK